MDEHGSSSLLERKEHHILYKKLSDEILEYEFKKKISQISIWIKIKSKIRIPKKCIVWVNILGV